jgi:hypothetical protein
MFGAEKQVVLGSLYQLLIIPPLGFEQLTSDRGWHVSRAQG